LFREANMFVLVDEVESWGFADLKRGHQNQRVKFETWKNFHRGFENRDGKYSFLQYTGTDGKTRKIL
jgi:hypothetical protein